MNNQQSIIIQLFHTKLYQLFHYIQENYVSFIFNQFTVKRVNKKHSPSLVHAVID